MTSYEGYNCAQIVLGNKSRAISQYSLKSKTNSSEGLLDFVEMLEFLFLLKGIILGCKLENYGLNIAETIGLRINP